jgi:Trk K+ transport system NAD-binding subunit
MPFLLVRVVRTLFLRRNLTLPLVVVGIVFATSWPLMWWAEPAGAPLVRPSTYWWWFLATCSTVGYGDLYPVTFAGHLVGGYVIVGGIVTLTTVLAQLALLLEHLKGRHMDGSTTIEYGDHVVVLGYTPGRTERMIDELLADGGRRVVLCATEEVTLHPMPRHPVDFVRGDPTDGAVLRRAGTHRAHSVLVDARDDNESLTVVLAVQHVAPHALKVVALRDLKHATHLHYVDPRACCVQWHSPRMLTEELQSPGISDVYRELMTHGGSDTHSLTLPEALEPLPFGEWQTTLGRRYGATVIAVRTRDALMVGPGWTDPVPGGSVLYYVSRRRLTPDEAVTALRPGLDARQAVGGRSG